MIGLEEARKIIDQHTTFEGNTETVELANALGRVLADKVRSDTDFPSFDKSAMDGYAIRSADISEKLRVIEFIPAGKLPVKAIGPGQCARIMTGGMVPAGSDMVVMQEDVEEVGFKSVRITNPVSKKNILFKGEDVKEGQLLLEKGVELCPAHLGILASAGVTNPTVFCAPALSLIATGDELVPPEEKPLPPRIRNSNTAQLTALAKKAGGNIVSGVQVGDDSRKIFEEVKKSLDVADIVILTGGASVGELDYTARVFEKLNAQMHFNKLAIQPGKPVLFATIGKKLLFGLSGNPVSSMVQFVLFVKPVINKLRGLAGKEETVIRIPLTTDKKRKKTERMLFFPVWINEKLEAEALEYHGSAHLHAYHKANGMAVFPKGLNELKKGTLVDVRPL